MFGYVVANMDRLDESQRQLYRGCYCGLCKALGKQHGLPCRMTLTYDMTFLILLLSSLQDETPVLEDIRCLVHPFTRQQAFTSRYTPYGADINVMLAHAQRLDDWRDDGKWLSLSQARLLARAAKKARQAYPRQAAAMTDSLKTLGQMEREGEPNPDLPAAAFGALLGEAFVPEEDMPKADILRAFGDALGRFIYLMDAAVDLKDDLKKERYNPLVAVPSSQHEGILSLLMSRCTMLYEKLGITRNQELIENVLYSGVWTRYRAKQQKEAAKA